MLQSTHVGYDGDTTHWSTVVHEKQLPQIILRFIVIGRPQRHKNRCHSSLNGGKNCETWSRCCLHLHDRFTLLSKSKKSDKPDLRNIVCEVAVFCAASYIFRSKRLPDPQTARSTRRGFRLMKFTWNWHENAFGCIIHTHTRQTAHQLQRQWKVV